MAAPCNLIIVNARVLTMDPDNPRASAVAICGNRIAAVGVDDDIRQMAAADARVIDAGGRTVLPGFIDSHVHLFQGAAALDFASVGGMTDLADVKAVVLPCAAERPDEPLILGTGAFYELFHDSDTAPRLLLDDIIADRPFALLAADVHTVWANTLALQKAGLFDGADTMPPGSTEVMGADGHASGMLVEAGAMGPLLALSRTGGRDMAGYITGADPEPPATPAERAADKELLLKGLDHAAAHGITAMHNMDGNVYLLELLSELEAEGRLKCRMEVPFHLKNYDPVDRLDEAAEMYARFRSEKVWSGRVKMFMDGVMESRTGLKSRAYPDQPDNHGEELFGPDHFRKACIKADALGLQISVHAIGDLAVQRVLDGYEAARQMNGVRDARHRIEHIELTTDDDLVRMKELDTVASMQPRHALFAGFFEPGDIKAMLFDDEIGLSFAWRTIRDHGIPLAFSTDWPVVPVDVMGTIQCAVAPTGLGPEWPDHSQTLMETLTSYTATNAWLAFRENHHGTLRVGLAADIVMLDGDIETHPAQDLGNLPIAMTMCDGEVTFEDRK